MNDQKETDPKEMISDPSDTSQLDSTPPDDSFSIRCPRLGHQINFKYCRLENSGIPCFKTLDCWYSHFDVLTHLKDNLSKEEFESAFVQKGKPKVFSLMELINQAKERQNNNRQNQETQNPENQDKTD